MSKDKISDYSQTANSNTDIGGINVDEGCAPSGINDAIRTLMKQLKDWQSGSQDVYIHPAGSASVPSITATGDTNTGLFFPAADTVGITTGGTERARVDSSGNLGLGVTPFANTLGKSIDLANGPGWFGYSTNSYFTTNAYFNSGWLYKANDYATLYQQGSGKHIWSTAASGTAGNAISFTQAMTLDASGNLGIGTTSPAHQLDVSNGARAKYLQVTNNGYAGSGATTPELYSPASGTLAFACSGAERARINSSGNLLVGTTTDSGKLTVSDSINPVNQSVYFENTNASFNARVISVNATRNTTNGTYKFVSFSISAVAEKFYVFDSGSAYNSTGTYGTISDIKLKENIVDATPKLSDVMRLQVRNFNFKTEPNEKQLGFVAQELEQVFPAMVQETEDKDENGELTGETTKQVKTTVLIPVLVKAIQELKAEFDAYKATHP